MSWRMSLSSSHVARDSFCRLIEFTTSSNLHAATRQRTTHNTQHTTQHNTTQEARRSTGRRSKAQQGQNNEPQSSTLE